MPIYTISFELRNQSQKHDYEPLQKELLAQKCHVLMQNLWLGSFGNNATQVHSFFQRYLDKTDRLLVAELPPHYAYSNAMQNVNKWLEMNPPQQPAPKVPAENPDKPVAASRKKAKA